MYYDALAVFWGIDDQVAVFDIKPVWFDELCIYNFRGDYILTEKIFENF